MRNFSWIVVWYSADHIPGMLAWSSNISIIFILNRKITLVLETEMLNWTAMKNHCGESVVSSFRAALRFWQWFCLCEVSETKVVIRPSSVMILLAFLSCFLVFFFLREGRNSFFSIKANRCVFEFKSVPCVYLFHCVIATVFDYGITTGSEYCT